MNRLKLSKLSEFLISNFTQCNCLVLGYFIIPAFFTLYLVASCCLPVSFLESVKCCALFIFSFLVLSGMSKEDEIGAS